MMKRQNGIVKLFVMLAFLVLSTCGGREALKVEPIPLTADPAKEVNNLEKEVSNARVNKLNLLTPTSFKNAEGYYNDSRAMLEKGEESAKVLEKVSLGRAELTQARERALIVKSTLVEVIEARASALDAGAANLGANYDDVEKRFLELTGAVENNYMKQAERDKDKVAEDFRKLEVWAIKVNLLGETKKLLEQAKKEGADAIAPRTYKEAQKKLSEADKFITENPQVKERRNELAGDALFLAQHTIHVTETSKKVREMKPEEITLWVGDVLHKTTRALEAPDMRNEKFVTQVENIIESIEALQDDRAFLAETVKVQKEGIDAMQKNHMIETEAMERQIALLEGLSRDERIEKERLAAESRAAEEKLASERQFNEKFNQVQGFFYEDEAEVYKQGNRLIIRLKGMKFPVGKAVIMPENYEILSKVQKAVRSFGDPYVLIEGHTDSTGPVLVNERLSNERAEAVRAYLLANRVVAKEKIDALGYGSEKPIASNETEEGRAKNRRIDIIIIPEGKAG